MNEHLENVLLQVSKSPRIDGGDFSLALRQIVEAACEGLYIRRTGVWFLTEGRNEIRCFLLIDKANQIETEDLSLTAEQYPDYFKHLLQERIIAAHDACKDPATHEFSESYLEPLGISSMLDAPIRHHGKMIGIICCEHVGPKRIWLREEMAFGSALADLIGRAMNASENSLAQERLQAANDSLEVKVEQRTRELTDALETLSGTQQQLVETAMMASLGSLVAGVAHEVNTPLGVSVTVLSHLQGRITELNSAFEAGSLSEKQFSQCLNACLEGLGLLDVNLNRAVRLIQDFKKTAVDQSLEDVNSFDLGETLGALIGSLNPELKKRQVAPRLKVHTEITMRSFPHAVVQVFTNLILNSLHHALENHEEPEIELDVSLHEQDQVVIQYRDNGCGIPAQYQQRIFEPFFTTRRGRGGSGLGLSICYNLVTQKLKGRIDVFSVEGEGCCFTVSMPRQLDAE